MHIIAAITGHEAHRLIFVGGDTHIYGNHVELAREQVKREPYPLPVFSFAEGRAPRSLDDVEKMTPKDFVISGYKSHPKIPYPLST